MRGLTGLDVNKIVTVNSATLDPNGSPYTLKTSDYFTINARFNNISIEYARGYFGTQNYLFGPDTSNFDFFKKIIGGSINLEDVDFNLIIENGFGIDAQLKFKKIGCINTRTGNTIYLNSNIIGQPINVTRALETGQQIKPVVPTKYTFNLDNSNIKSMIENLPDKMTYNIDITSNPLGNVSSGNDFYYYGNDLKAILKFEMPLSLIANNLIIGDSVNFNLEKPENNPVNYGTFTLIADNGFPFSALLQIYMIGPQNTVIDSFFQSKIISPAPVNADNIAVGTTRTYITINADNSFIDKLYSTKKLYIKAKFDTDHSQYTKIYNFYKLNCKLTGKFNYMVKQ